MRFIEIQIEDDWYLSKDDYSWRLARKVSNAKRKRPWVNDTYHSTPEEALNEYLHIKQRESAGKAADGTIYDLVDILLAEKKRLRPRLENVYKQAIELE